MLPAPAPPVGLFAEFGGLEGAVAHWDGIPAVRRRLEARADGDRRSDVAAPAAVILDRHAGTAAAMDDFHRRLSESKQARYPAEEFGRIRCGVAPDA